MDISLPESPLKQHFISPCHNVGTETNCVRWDIHIQILETFLLILSHPRELSFIEFFTRASGNWRKLFLECLIEPHIEMRCWFECPIKFYRGSTFVTRLHCIRNATNISVLWWWRDDLNLKYLSLWVLLCLFKESQCVAATFYILYKRKSFYVLVVGGHHSQQTSEVLANE